MERLDMEATLREIADAVWRTRGDPSEDERQRIYDRARMLRDRSLIRSTNEGRQGKTATFTEADVAAAVVALNASLNGMPWSIIELVNLQLRRFRNGGGVTGIAAFEDHLPDIAAGKPVFVRLDILPLSPEARMGGVEVLSEFPAADASQVIIWPVTALAKPVLDLLAAD